MGFTMTVLRFLIQGFQSQMFNLSLMKQLFLYDPEKLEKSDGSDKVVKVNPSSVNTTATEPQVILENNSILAKLQSHYNKFKTKHSKFITSIESENNETDLDSKIKSLFAKVNKLKVFSLSLNSQFVDTLRLFFCCHYCRGKRSILLQIVN